MGLSVAIVSESVSATLVLRNIIFLDRSAGALFSSAIDNFDRSIEFDRSINDSIENYILYNVFCCTTQYSIVYVGLE